MTSTDAFLVDSISPRLRERIADAELVIGSSGIEAADKRESGIVDACRRLRPRSRHVRDTTMEAGMLRQGFGMLAALAMLALAACSGLSSPGSQAASPHPSASDGSMGGGGGSDGGGGGGGGGGY